MGYPLLSLTRNTEPARTFWFRYCISEALPFSFLFHLSTLSTTLFLDIETNGNQLLDVGAVLATGELHKRSTATLETWIQKATHVCGHNLVAHDAPFLRKKLKSKVFADKALVDTLFWSALMFPEKPYHKLVKGYHLVNDEVSNPLSDSKLCKQLLIEELGRFQKLPQAMRDIHTRCSTIRMGMVASFSWLVSSQGLPRLRKCS